MSHLANDQLLARVILIGLIACCYSFVIWTARRNARISEAVAWLLTGGGILAIIWSIRHL